METLIWSINITYESDGQINLHGYPDYAFFNGKFLSQLAGNRSSQLRLPSLLFLGAIYLFLMSVSIFNRLKAWHHNACGQPLSREDEVEFSLQLEQQHASLSYQTLMMYGHSILLFILVAQFWEQQHLQFVPFLLTPFLF